MDYSSSSSMLTDHTFTSTLVAIPQDHHPLDRIWETQSPNQSQSQNQNQNLAKMVEPPTTTMTATAVATATATNDRMNHMMTGPGGTLHPPAPPPPTTTTTTTTTNSQFRSRKTGTDVFRKKGKRRKKRNRRRTSSADSSSIASWEEEDFNKDSNHTKENGYRCCRDRTFVRSTLHLMNIVAKILMWCTVLALVVAVGWYSYELKNKGYAYASVSDPPLISILFLLSCMCSLAYRTSSSYPFFLFLLSLLFYI